MNISISANEEEKEEIGKNHNIVSKYIKISIITFGILTMTLLLLLITREIYKLYRSSAPRGNHQNPDNADMDNIYTSITECWLNTLSYEIRKGLRMCFSNIVLRVKKKLGKRIWKLLAVICMLIFKRPMLIDLVFILCFTYCLDLGCSVPTWRVRLSRDL